MLICLIMEMKERISIPFFTTMKLSSLSLLSIECELLRSIDFRDVIRAGNLHCSQHSTSFQNTIK